MNKTLAALSVASLLLLTACSSEAKTVCDFEDIEATSYDTLNDTFDKLGEVTSGDAFIAGDLSELNAWGEEAQAAANQVADTLDKEAAIVAGEPIAEQYALAQGFVTGAMGEVAKASAEATDATEFSATMDALFSDTEWVAAGDAGDAAFGAVNEYILEECAAS